MLDRQKVQLTSIMWREPSALGPDIIATYEGDTLSVRCPDGGLVVASLRSQPFKYAAVARESPDMTSLDSAPCHECNPTTIWRVRGLKLTNGLIHQGTGPLIGLIHDVQPTQCRKYKLTFIWAGGYEIGRAHVCTPVTNAQLVCRLLLAKNKHHHI